MIECYMCREKKTEITGSKKFKNFIRVYFKCNNPLCKIRKGYMNLKEGVTLEEFLKEAND